MEEVIGLSPVSISNSDSAAPLRCLVGWFFFRPGAWTRAEEQAAEVWRTLQLPLNSTTPDFVSLSALYSSGLV